LVLSALGVSRDAIFEDYLLTERFFDQTCTMILGGTGDSISFGAARELWERTWFNVGVDCHIRAASIAGAVALNIGYCSRTDLRDADRAWRNAPVEEGVPLQLTIALVDVYPFSGSPNDSSQTRQAHSIS
jgi:hypothetical protein